MKVLIQEPLVSRSLTYGKFSAGAGNNTFPYGAACVARYAMDRGFEVAYLEPSIEGMDAEAYSRYFREHDFSVVGIGSTTLQIKRTLETFALVKRIKPGAVTVLGGVHGTLMPEETMAASPALDYLVIGEGEKPFHALLCCLRDGTPERIAAIPGLAYRQGGRVVVNPPTPANTLAPAELPVPPYSIFPMSRYVAQITYTKRFPSYSIVASRGCPYRCAFCNGSSVLGPRVRYKDPSVLIDEMLALKNEYGARGIIFLDSTFTVSRRWLEEFCRKYIERKVDLPWACNSRVDTVDEATLRLMKAAGCWELLYGIESANQKSLDMIDKRTTVEQNAKMLRLTMALGFYTYASYILCLPGETEADAMNTVRFAREIGTPIAMFYLPVPYPKTRLYEVCKEKGILRTGADWEDFNAWDFTNPVYINPLIGKENMQRILNRAYSSYYSTPKVLWRNFKEVALLRQDLRKFVYAVKGLGGMLMP
jgi:radical SAM superfamily enzyme YgiQ (UPF0313 family)